MRSKAVAGAAIVALLSAAGFAQSAHENGCTVSSADPATYTEVSLPNGAIYYVEERPATDVGIYLPASGFLLGGATMIYEEINTVDGLQRGAWGDCLPYQELCLIIGEDDTVDVNCFHGPDLFQGGLLWPL